MASLSDRFLSHVFVLCSSHCFQSARPRTACTVPKTVRRLRQLRSGRVGGGLGATCMDLEKIWPKVRHAAQLPLCGLPRPGWGLVGPCSDVDVSLAHFHPVAQMVACPLAARMWDAAPRLRVGLQWRLRLAVHSTDASLRTYSACRKRRRHRRGAWRRLRRPIISRAWG